MSITEHSVLIDDILTLDTCPILASKLIWRAALEIEFESDSGEERL